MSVAISRRSCSGAPASACGIRVPGSSAAGLEIQSISQSGRSLHPAPSSSGGATGRNQLAHSPAAGWHSKQAPSRTARYGSTVFEFCSVAPSSAGQARAVINSRVRRGLKVTLNSSPELKKPCKDRRRAKRVSQRGPESVNPFLLVRCSAIGVADHR